MVNKVVLDEKYKYIIRRASYETFRAASNIVFEIDEHLSDEDAHFLDSDLMKRLTDRGEKTYANYADMETGVLLSVLDELPKQHSYDDITGAYLYS